MSMVMDLTGKLIRNVIAENPVIAGMCSTVLNVDNRAFFGS